MLIIYKDKSPDPIMDRDFYIDRDLTLKLQAAWLL
ncbi:hypothetical protein J2X77_004348 [Sphingobacterium sp. 2149]|nr:hypothetical protein [Sphingobacterium sp. 2149]